MYGESGVRGSTCGAVSRHRSHQPGEYGELTIELAATLAARNVPVTPAERDELAALLDAMGMPADPIARLNVQA
jgi:hypothetical protein